VVQSTQDWQSEDLAIISMGRDRQTIPFWDLLFNTLMWPGLIEVLDIGMKDTLQLLLLQDEQVIETLATHTAQKPFTDGIGARSVRGCFQDLNAAGGGHSSKTGTKLAITIPIEILRPSSIGSRFPKLLRRPGIGWRASDTHMDDLTSVQIDE
jgi:hypothetical protein